MKIKIPSDKIKVVLQNKPDIDKFIELMKDNLDIADVGEKGGEKGEVGGYFYKESTGELIENLPIGIWMKDGEWDNLQQISSITGFIPLQQFIDEYEVKEEQAPPLVFGEYKIDDIVVSLLSNNYREEGEILKVLEGSNKDFLFFIGNETGSSSRSSWRKATKEEEVAYYKGIRNIRNIKQPKKSLIQQADDEYKKGDRFIDLVNKAEFTVKADVSAITMNDDSIYVSVEPKDGYSNKSARVYKDGAWAQKLATKEPTLKNEKRVVHTTAQQQWDFVIEKLGYNNITKSDFNSYKEKSCININESLICDKEYYIDHGYEILSFYTWVIEVQCTNEWNKYSDPNKEVIGALDGKKVGLPTSHIEITGRLVCDKSFEDNLDSMLSKSKIKKKSINIEIETKQELNF